MVGTSGGVRRVLEAIPGIGVFPFWCVVVVAMAVWGTARPKLK
jgi:hypothetical protein